MFSHLWQLVIAKQMIAPAAMGAFSGLVIFLLILLLRAPRETVVIEVGPAPDPNLIQVSVSGEVLRPGIYQIPRGSDAEAAVAAAGGFTQTADTAAISLSAELENGDLLQVPAKTRAQANSDEVLAAGSGTVNINTADVAALDVLPGIGPALAQRVVDYRAQFGPFQSVDELALVSGISERMVDELRPLITVGG